MDSFELNKIMGAILGTCMFVLGLQIFAGIVFTPHKPAIPGYDLPAPTEGAHEQEAPAEPLPVLLAKADPGKGKTAFNKCAACHNVGKDAAAKVGPTLYGIVGRPKGSHAGFAYSAAMKAKGGEWTYEEINAFITNPRAHVPGTIMAFAGDPSAPDRAEILAYLRTLSDNPVPFPQPEPAAQTEGEPTAEPAAQTAPQDAPPAPVQPAPQGTPAPQSAPAPEAPPLPGAPAETRPQ